MQRSSADCQRYQKGSRSLRRMEYQARCLISCLSSVSRWNRNQVRHAEKSEQLVNSFVLQSPSKGPAADPFRSVFLQFIFSESRGNVLLPSPNPFSLPLVFFLQSPLLVVVFIYFFSKTNAWIFKHVNPPSLPGIVPLTPKFIFLICIVSPQKSNPMHPTSFLNHDSETKSEVSRKMAFLTVFIFLNADHPKGRDFSPTLLVGSVGDEPQHQGRNEYVWPGLQKRNFCFLHPCSSPCFFSKGLTYQKNHLFILSKLSLICTIWKLFSPTPPKVYSWRDIWEDE